LTDPSFNFKHQETMNTQTLPIFMTMPGTGKVFNALGDEVTVMLSGEQTGGAFTMVQVVTPPGGGPPPHCHANEDEWFFVQEGRIELWSGGVWTEVSAGTAIFLPRGVPHTYRNCGDKPLRILVHAAPAGFEIFFERMAEACAAPGGPDMQKIGEIAASHGIQFLPPQ
jgi:quercetin dioxygenase-like cupin family protein